MPEEDDNKKGFNELMHDLEDNIFSIGGEEHHPGTTEPLGEPAPADPKVKKPTRRETLPTLVDKETAGKILKDFMKEKNQRKYDLMGLELLFKPYWFFTYSCELLVRDKDKNITDAQEVGGRVAVDAVNGNLADYLQDLIDHEPIEIVDLADEITQIGGDAKIIEPRISEDKLEKFVQQKIAGTMRAERENVSVAGFELLWAPVYRYWMTIRKKTHNVQIDGCGGYPANYDDMPVKEKTWADIIRNDLELLKDPKELQKAMKKRGGAMKKSVSGGGKGGGPQMSAKKIELLAAGALAIAFFYGLSIKSLQIMVISGLLVAVLFWYMNSTRKKPLMPLPPPPGYDYYAGGTAPPQ
jgi:hypothetical protein